MKTLIMALLLSCFLYGGPIEDLKPGCWYEVPNSRLDAVQAPDAQFPWIHGVSGVYCAITCWCGGAYDTKRERVYIGPGGGHAGYAGNEVYAFSIPTLTWSRLNDPTPLASGECTADSVPFALHSYDGGEYMPNVDKYIMVGGWCTDKTYAMNLSTYRWTATAACGDPRTGDVSAYDPISGNLYYVSGMAGRLLEWNPNTSTWTARTGAVWNYHYYGTATVDPKRHLFVVVGGGYARTFLLTSPWTYTQLATTGDKEIEGAGNPGTEYDPVMDKIICWRNGTDVYSLDLDSKVWTRHSASSANATAPTAANSNGTYGRFRYMPARNAYVLVNNTNENVFIYKLTSWQDTLPVTGLNVYAQDTTIEQYLWTYLTVTASRQGGGSDTVTGNCIYASLDTAVAVTASSKIIGKTTGSARIQVTKSTARGIFRDTISINVVASTALLDSIRIVPASAKVLTGDPYGLKTTGYFHKNGLYFTRLLDTVAAWASQNSDVATVTRGVVTGAAAGGPVNIIASMSGKADTAVFTVQARPSFIKRINFQVSATPWSYGWLAENGQGFTAQTGYGWNTNLTSTARDDRSGANFLLKSFISGAPSLFRITAPDGNYIIKIGMGDNDYGTASYNWTAAGADTVCRKLPSQGNGVVVDTITVTGGSGAAFTVNGPINYIVMISNEGIDINTVAWDDGTAVPLPASVRDTVIRMEKAAEFRAYPNPFNPAITIAIGNIDDVKELGIYNLQGRKMADLTQRIHNGKAVWEPKLPSGMYIIRLTLDHHMLTKRILFMK